MFELKRLALCVFLLLAISAILGYIYNVNYNASSVTVEESVLVELPLVPERKIVDTKSYHKRYHEIKNRQINEAERVDLLRELDKEFDEVKASFFGTITEIVSLGSSYDIDIKSVGENEILHKAKCNIDGKFHEAVYKLRVGQSISIIGEVYFFFSEGSHVSLKKCEIDNRK